MRVNWSLVRPCAFILLPALALCGVGVYFLVDEAPKVVSARRGDCTLYYKSEAARLWRHPERSKSPRERGKGWRQASKLTVTNGVPVAWGHVRGGATELVWVGNDRKGVLWTEVEPQTEDVLWAWLYVGVPSALTVVLAMALVGIWFFVRYARERDDFVAATTHDLTTPLVSLRDAIGYDADEARLLAERMLRMVSNLREHLQPGRTRSRPASVAFDLVRAYEEAYALFRDDFRDLYGGADVPREGLSSLMALGDETVSVQILWNLLGNDLKYAAPHGKVRIAFARENDFAVVRFIDEGPGMTRRQRHRAFDRYYRARTVRESGKGGFGLGLCAARESARLMGGDLVVTANRPRGCVFAFSLPLAACPPEPEGRG